MIVTYDELVALWGIVEIRRLSHLEASEDPQVLRKRVDDWLEASESEFFGLTGYNASDAPEYVKSAGKGIIPVLTRFHLQPTEANRDAFAMLMDQLYELLKMKQKYRLAGIEEKPTVPAPVDDVYIFVV